jgi:carbonic anhydrase
MLHEQAIPLTTLLLAVAVLAPLVAQQKAAVMTKEMQASVTPDRALQMLKDGNARFVSGRMLHRDYIDKVKLTSEGQYPFAVILGCLDSRQTAEILFDQGIGDIFVARVAGNVLNDDILGSLEFATKVAGAKLIAVVGHSNCGAVKGAVDGVELDHLTGLLRKIKPAVEAAGTPGQKHTSKDLAFVDKVAAENAKLVAEEMRAKSKTLRELIDAGNLKIVNGMYDISTGQVKFLDH